MTSFCDTTAKEKAIVRVATIWFRDEGFNIYAPCVLYIMTGVSLLSRERFLYI